MPMLIFKAVVALALLKEARPITLADHQITLTMYEYGVSWNRAEATCKHNGGTLYIDDSPERKAVLSSFAQSWPNNHLWIGLHYPETESNSTYGWTDCFGQNLENFDNWSDGHPDNATSERCVFSDRNTGEWKSKPCQDDSRFVCQNNGGVCTFTNGTGMPTQSSGFEAINITTSDLYGCLRQCLNQMYSFKNCWAANYDERECILYFTTDPFLFQAQASNTSSASFHIKLCYNNNGTISTEDTSIIANDTADPNSDCVIFNEQTTPTTIVPTTASTSSTSTTTITMTTSTSSTTGTTSQTSTLTSSTSTATYLTTSTSSSTLTTTVSSSSVASTYTTNSSSSAAITSSSSVSSSTLTESSTSTLSTSAPASNSSCRCTCTTVTSGTLNLTLSEKVESIKSALKIDTETLSANKRKKMSAKDDRTSSQTIGFAALSIIFVEIFLVVFADFINVAKFIFDNLKGYRA